VTVAVIFINHHWRKASAEKANSNFSLHEIKPGQKYLTSIVRENLEQHYPFCARDGLSVAKSQQRIIFKCYRVGT
jgi:hypothetical protein